MKIIFTYSLGACPHGFGLRRMLRDDGAHSHPPAFTCRAPGCPLEFGSPRAGFWPVLKPVVCRRAVSSSTLGARPATPNGNQGDEIEKELFFICSMKKMIA